MSTTPSISSFTRLLGTWATEATHPAMPGLVVRGTAVVEWLEGERFLLIRARTDHKDFPDSLWVVGDMGQDRAAAADASGAGRRASPSSLQMHYFDSRGVFRVYETEIDADAWRWWRDAAGFSQRFTGRLADGGRTIVGLSQLCEDDAHWRDDLAITYRRVDGA